jgi:hypothetical protein
MRHHFATSVVLALQATACASGVSAPADTSAALTTPSAIAVPPGQSITLQAHGVGFQIYQCLRNADGKKVWTFHAPAAQLFATDGTLVATHFGGVDVGLPAGVYWQSSLDGSRVHGGNAITSPVPGAIPQVRLDAVDTAGIGIYQDTSFIQRLNTVGGLAPTGNCAKLDTLLPVAYEADYVFYAAGLPRPEVPTNIAVADGFNLIHQFHAEGFQVYQCTADATGATSFSFFAPRADLVDADGNLVVKHFGGVEANLPAGVYWQSVNDGSFVHAGHAVTAPNDGAIPLVRLTTLDTAGTGILSRVAFVQRLNTVGGVQPAGPCAPVGALTPVPYSADYFFYLPEETNQ